VSTGPAAYAQSVARNDWERAIRADPTVTKTILLVLLTVATYADPDGSRVFPSAKTVSEHAGLGESTVRQHLTDARDRGYLRLVQRGGKRGGRLGQQGLPNRYELTLPTSSTASHIAVEDPVTSSTASPTAVESPVTSSTASGRAVLGPSTADFSSFNRQLGSAYHYKRPIHQDQDQEREVARPMPSSRPGGGGGEVDETTHPDNRLLTAFLEALPVGLGVRRTNAVRAHVVAAHVRGWDPVLLAKRVGRHDYSGAANKSAVAVNLLAELAQSPPPAVVSSEDRTPVKRLQWCGQCRESNRRLEDEQDGRDRGACPTCHPVRAAGLVAAG
jgi:hypothetical protein